MISVTGRGIVPMRGTRLNLQFSHPRTVAILGQGDFACLLVSDQHELGIVFDLPRINMDSTEDGHMVIDEWVRGCRIAGVRFNFDQNIPSTSIIFSVCADMTRPGIYYMSTQTAIRRGSLRQPSSTLIAGDDTVSANNGFADGMGKAARFNGLDGMTVSITGETLFACDHGNHRVRAINLKTLEVSTVAEIWHPLQCAFYRSPSPTKNSGSSISNILFITR